jgi:hypothetical protein
MKKMLLLAMAMFLVGLFFGSVALAQGTTMNDGTTIIEILRGPTIPASSGGPANLAPSGGPAILLPGAALVLGAGVLTYTILRRRT